VSLTLLFGILTLAPAVAAILVLALGLARRPLLPAVLVLAALGVLVPIVTLLELAPDVSFVIPLRVSLLGGPLDTAFTPLLRADALGLYAAFGVALLIVPFLIWIALRSAPASVLVTSPEETVESESGEQVVLVRSMLPSGKWASIALILGLESALLMLCFADNVGWMALCWIIVVALVWALGEIGSESAMLDYPGLGFLALGPALWLIAMLFVMSDGKASALLDLTGAGAAGFGQSLLLAIALAAAGGGYPFLAWLRRRAAFATPAGLAAVAMGVIPAAIFVGGRTYGAVTSKQGLWPIIGVANPPITAGVAFVLLGGFTVAIAGLLALSRRDLRSLVALLAASQTGWGLVAIGTEQPASAGALVFLLATSVLGMGALLGSAVVGGMLSADDEPEGAGPRPYDQPLRMPTLLAWGIGALTLLGVPLFAGFTVLDLVSAGALEGTKVAIPLVGLAWGGGALLTLSLLRATAPALTYTLADDEAEEELLDEEEVPEDEVTADIVSVTEGESVTESSAPDEEPDGDSDEEATGESDEPDAESTGEFVVPSGASFWRENLPLLPAALFAALALVLGIVPQALFGFGANLAAGDLLQSGAFAHNVNVTPTGFILPTGQWVPSIAWAIVLVLVIVFVLLRMLRPRAAGAIDTLQAEDAEEVVDEDEAAVEDLEESASLAAPTEVWEQLSPAFASEWLQPGAFFLLGGTDDDMGSEESSEDASDDDALDTEVTAETEEPEQDHVEDGEPAEPAEQDGAGTAAPRSKPARRIRDKGV
jgi:formate hydrogenlyase subunit 3/multisubunit Na+/H+ antiporter MnhD subunit